MPFPLSTSEILLWLGATAILLLITSELLSSSYGQINILIDKKRLHQIAIIFVLVFLFYAVTLIYEIFTY